MFVLTYISNVSYKFNFNQTSNNYIGIIHSFLCFIISQHLSESTCREYCKLYFLKETKYLNKNIFCLGGLQYSFYEKELK